MKGSNKEEKMSEVKIGKIYRHFKGNLYLVEGIAIDSETDKIKTDFIEINGNCAK